MDVVHVGSPYNCSERSRGISLRRRTRRCNALGALNDCEFLKFFRGLVGMNNLFLFFFWALCKSDLTNLLLRKCLIKVSERSKLNVSLLLIHDFRRETHYFPVEHVTMSLTYIIILFNMVFIESD